MARGNRGQQHYQRGGRGRPYNRGGFGNQYDGDIQMTGARPARQSQHQNQNNEDHGPKDVKRKKRSNSLGGPLFESKGPLVDSWYAQQVSKALEQSSEAVGDVVKKMVQFHHKFDARGADEVKTWMLETSNGLKGVARTLRELQTTFDKTVFEHRLQEIPPPTPNIKDEGELPDKPLNADVEFVSLLPNTTDGFDMLLKMWVERLRTSVEPQSTPEDTAKYVDGKLLELMVPKERPFWDHYFLAVVASVVGHKAELIRAQCLEEARLAVRDEIKAEIRPQLQSKILHMSKGDSIVALHIPKPDIEPTGVRVVLDSPSKHPSYAKPDKASDLLAALEHEVWQEIVDEGEQHQIFLHERHNDGRLTPVHGSRSPKAVAAMLEPSANLDVPLVDATGKTK
jgi:hypothetical protein